MPHQPSLYESERDRRPKRRAKVEQLMKVRRAVFKLHLTQRLTFKLHATQRILTQQCDAWYKPYSVQFRISSLSMDCFFISWVLACQGMKNHIIIIPYAPSPFSSHLNLF